VLLIYFGYVNCPDVCPVSIAAGAGALNALSPAERERTRMIMVSVDPERDTPAALKTYVAYFHPQMLGAVGSAAETAAVAKQFGAGYVRQPTRPDGGYAVDHSSQTYVVDREGRLVEMLRSARRPKDRGGGAQAAMSRPADRALLFLALAGAPLPAVFRRCRAPARDGGW
jgi:protein SCO1/2